MAEPSPDDVAKFTAGVQHHIDTLEALGETISWDDAAKQFSNFLANYAADPEGTEKLLASGSRLDATELAVSNLDARVTYLENVAGGTVVAADPGAQ